MNPRRRWTTLIGLATLVVCPAIGMAADGGRRTSSGAINVAPPPAVFVVVLVDAKGGTVVMRGDDGRSLTVEVDAGTYDLAKLRPGERIQVDFVEQASPDARPKAASIWPAK